MGQAEQVWMKLDVLQTRAEPGPGWVHCSEKNVILPIFFSVLV